MNMDRYLQYDSLSVFTGRLVGEFLPEQMHDVVKGGAEQMMG